MIFIKQIWKCDNECSVKGNHTIEKLERTIQHPSERRGKKKRSGTSEEVTIDPTWRMEHTRWRKYHDQHSLVLVWYTT